jgi:hypothetical protein
MTSYEELCDYLSTFTVVPGVKSVVIGDDEALMENMVSRIAYPVLWWETPDVSFTWSDDHPKTRFDLACAVVSNDNVKTAKNGNKILSDMLLTLQAVYAKIYEDAFGVRDFDIILKTNNAAPVRRWSADNAYGWRFEVSIELFRSEKVN